MLNIALPTGILLSPLKTKLEKFFLLQTYVASHQAYLNRDGFLARWDNIGANLQISVSLVTILDNNPAPVAQIAVRCIDSESVINAVSFLVEAESNSAIYQEVVTLYRVGTKPVIAALRSIPLRAIFITDKLEFFQSYDNISIKLLNVEPPLSNLVDPRCNVWLRHPTNFDLLNDRFEERWGSYWSMAAVDSEIREFALWFRYHLVLKGVYGDINRNPFRAACNRIVRTFIWRPICWLITRELLLTIYFWLPILLHMRKFEAKDVSHE